MLKITLMESTQAMSQLRLEGRVAGPWVGEVRRACEKFLEEGQSLRLDLSEVSFADVSGVAALASLRNRGVMLVGCSPFIFEQLKTASA